MTAEKLGEILKRTYPYQTAPKPTRVTEARTPPHSTAHLSKRFNSAGRILEEIPIRLEGSTAQGLRMGLDTNPYSFLTNRMDWAAWKEGWLDAKRSANKP